MRSAGESVAERSGWVRVKARQPARRRGFMVCGRGSERRATGCLIGSPKVRHRRDRKRANRPTIFGYFLGRRFVGRSSRFRCDGRPY